MRLENWVIRLAAYFAETRDREFAWGTHDCVLFALGAVEAVTGINPRPDLQGTYTTQSGALAALSAAGYANLPEALAATVGPSKPPLFAQRGDIVTLGPFTCGVVDLTGEFAVCLDPVAGFVFMPLADAEMAFTAG